MPQDFYAILDALAQTLHIGHGTVDRLDFWCFVALLYRGVLMVINRFM